MCRVCSGVRVRGAVGEATAAGGVRPGGLQRPAGFAAPGAHGWSAHVPAAHISSHARAEPLPPAACHLLHRCRLLPGVRLNPKPQIKNSKYRRVLGVGGVSRTAYSSWTGDQISCCHVPLLVVRVARLASFRCAHLQVLGIKGVARPACSSWTGDQISCCDIPLLVVRVAHGLPVSGRWLGSASSAPTGHNYLLLCACHQVQAFAEALFVHACGWEFAAPVALPLLMCCLGLCISSCTIQQTKSVLPRLLVRQQLVCSKTSLNWTRNVFDQTNCWHTKGLNLPRIFCKQGIVAGCASIYEWISHIGTSHIHMVGVFAGSRLNISRSFERPTVYLFSGGHAAARGALPGHHDPARQPAEGGLPEGHGLHLAACGCAGCQVPHAAAAAGRGAHRGAAARAAAARARHARAADRPGSIPPFLPLSFFKFFGTQNGRPRWYHLLLSAGSERQKMSKSTASGSTDNSSCASSQAHIVLNPCCTRVDSDGLRSFSGGSCAQG